MKHLFFGGIHPKYNKEMSTGITEFKTVVPEYVVIPMQQHIGKMNEPLVKVGDHVLRGQKIGDNDGLCVPVHASVSGKVAAVEPRLHTNGSMVMSVVIENDYKDECVPFTACGDALDQLDADEVLHKIREAGIVGMGGAAFPGNIKAMGALGKVDTLIANACECEPYITADDSLLRTRPEEILSGMEILKSIIKPARAVLAVEDNKKGAIKAIENILKNHPGIEIAVLPTRYPQGSEKQLIQALTGREVPPGSLPASIGCAVFNVATYASIYRAVRFGEPITQRIVTVSGEAIANPQNFIVRIGTTFHDLIKEAGGLNDKTERVISGGPMMGFAQKDLSVPVIKATNSVLCLLKDKNGAAENPVCIRCGKCVSVCPMRLQPLYMYRYQQSGDVKALERLNITDCMECGSCAFTCPGKLPLVECFRHGKRMLKEANQK